MFEDELAAVVAQPPRPGVLPGMRLSSAIPRSTLILLVAFMLFFGAFPLSIMSADPRARLDLGPNRVAEGRVVSTSDVSSCRNSDGRRIVYAFSPEGGKEYRGTNVVSEVSPYYSAQVGDKIEIRYLVRDPIVSAVAGSDSNEPPIFVFMLFPAFFFLVFSPLYFPQIREVMRARRLYKTGVLLQGNVVFVKKRGGATWPGWPGSSTADVYVAHQLPGGGRAETIAWCTNDWLINQLSPGTPVHILLSPKKSQRGALLEAFLR
jgi:hypothetical protein